MRNAHFTSAKIESTIYRQVQSLHKAMTTVLFLLVTIPAAGLALRATIKRSKKETQRQSWTLGEFLEIIALLVVSFIMFGYCLDINDWLSHHEDWREAYMGTKLIACALWIMLVFYLLFFRKT